VTASPLHPGAWAIWAVATVAAVAITGNPAMLVLIMALVGLVYAACRSDPLRDKAFGLALKVGLAVMVLRTVASLVGTGGGTTVLFRLPVRHLPTWAGGGGIGGPVTLELIARRTQEGLRITALLVVFAVLASAVDPGRLVRLAPGYLYEAGLVATVALTFVPQTLAGLTQVREAQRLRGRRPRGLRDAAGLMLPLLLTTLERSLTLAASMDSRGFGRRGASTLVRRTSSLLALTGAGAMAVGAFAMLSPGETPFPGRILAVVGAVTLILSTLLASRGRRPTRFRRETWEALDWIVAAAAVAAAAGLMALRSAGLGDLTYAVGERIQAPGFNPLAGLALLPLAVPALAGAARSTASGDALVPEAPA